LLSQISILLILSQVVLVMNQDKKLKNKTLLYTLFACVTLVAFMSSKTDYSIHKAPNGHLVWDWLSSWPTWYWAFWVLCVFSILLHMKSYNMFMFYLITLSISYYTYSSSGTSGSMWCWIANILAFFWIAKVFYKDLCY
jgi:hypothetical protein